jgi:hypothetical protein
MAKKNCLSDCLCWLFWYYASGPKRPAPKAGSTKERKQFMAPTVACPFSAESEETTGKLPPAVLAN